MNYTSRLLARQAATGRPVRVGVVGAGQMGSGLIAQIERAQGMQVAVVADISAERGQAALERAGRGGALIASDLAEATRLMCDGKPVVVSDGLLVAKLPVDIVVEVSGVPEVAAQVAFAALMAKKDVALMTVEADVTVGLLLASVANATGSVYTICRGDEPVEALKLVEYTRDLGLTVVAAGKGKNNPNRPSDTQDDVMAEALAKNMNPRMLCEFTDGTKTQIEMCALSNATGFPVDVAGMHGVASDVAELASRLIPHRDGGILTSTPVVEYTYGGDVAPGVFVVVKSESPVITHELDYLKLGTGPYYALFRPYHLASIEALLSISEAVLDRRADFQTVTWRSEVVAKVKSDVAAGTVLEGMGGRHVHGWTIDADDARELNAIPIGLIGGCRARRDLKAGDIVGYADVEVDETRPLVAMRRMQDALLASGVI